MLDDDKQQYPLPSSDLLKPLSAEKKFTDRENLIERFMEVVRNSNSSNEKVIFNFYGIGGIGKSSLCNHFLEILKNEKSIVGIKINFENKQFLEPVNFLFELRKQIAEHEPKFKFTVFDAAFAHYWMNAYSHLPLKEKAKELPIIDLLTEIADAVSPISIFSAVKLILELSAKKLNKFQTKLNLRAQPFLVKYLQLKDISDMERFLPQALSIDLALNLEKSRKRIFFFIDTLEKLWGSQKKHIGELSFLQDWWLRDTIAHTLNQCANKVYWFLFSREYLSWGQIDEKWDNILEQHLIGQLSIKDCKLFLTSAGIKNEKLLEHIANVSKGLPFFLDRAVDLYYNIKNTENREPTTNDFPMGEIAIIQRYLKYCNKDDLLLIKILSVPRIWGQKLFEYLIKELNLPFTLIDYKTFIRHTFIQELGNNRFSLHQLLRDYIYEYFRKEDQKIVKKLHKLLAEFYSQYLNLNSIEQLSPEKLELLNEWLYHGIRVNAEKAVLKFLQFAEKMLPSGYYRYLYKALQVILPFEQVLKGLYWEVLLLLARCEFALGFNENAEKHFNQVLDNFNKTNKKDDNFVTCLLGLGDIERLKGNLSDAINYYNRALKISSEAKNRKKTIIIVNRIGEVLDSLCKYDEALKCYQRALELAEIENYTFEKAEILNNIGLVFDRLGKYSEGLKYYKQALKVATQTSNKKEQATILNNIGSILDTWGKYDQALDYYQKALKITQDLGDKEGEATILNNIGFVYDSRGQLEKALEYYNRALEISILLEDKDGEATYLSNIGFIMTKLNEFPKAIDYYLKALELAKKIGDKSQEASYLRGLSDVYASMEKIKEAQQYYEKAITIAKNMGFKTEIVQCMRVHGKILKLQGKYGEALSSYNDALKLAQEVEEKNIEADILQEIGFIYIELKNSSEALKYLKMAFNVWKELNAEKKLEIVMKKIIELENNKSNSIS